MKTNLSDPRRYGMLMFAEDDGAAAVAEVPVNVEAVASDNDFLGSLTLPDANDFLDETQTPTQPAQKIEPKPVDSQQENQSAGEKGKPGPKPGAAALREQLALVERERDEAREQIKKGDPRLGEYEQAVKDAKAEVEKQRQETDRYRKQFAMADPEVTRELDELNNAYEKSALGFYRDVPEISHPDVLRLVQEYDQLPFNTPQYREARMAFNAKVNTVLNDGDESGTPNLSLSRTLEWIAKTHEHAVKMPEIRDRIERSAVDLQRKAREEGWSKEQKSIRDRLTAAREVPDELRKNRPYDPRVVADSFLKSMSPEDAARIEEGIDDFVEMAITGGRPLSDKDFAGMSPSQIKEAREQQESRVAMIKEQLPAVIFNGMRSHRLVPTLVREVQRLREKLNEENASRPPDPTAGGETGKDHASDDLTGLTPPPIPSSF